MSYRIITDSTTDLSPDLLGELRLEVIPLTFLLNGKEYQDRPYGEDMPAKDFYKAIREGAMPTTSQVTPERFCEYFEPILKGGQDILYLAFSSGLSGTCNAAMIAAEDLAEKYPERRVIVIDTLAASMGEGLLVYLACLRHEEGMELDELAEWVREKRLHIAHWFTVDDLHHLKRGGRVSGAATFVGTMLNIKPVLHVDDEGHLIPMEKVRGRKNSLDTLVEHMKKTGTDFSKQTVFISHSDCLEDAEYVAERVKKDLGVPKVCIGYIGPVIGSHTGVGTVALFFDASHRN